LRKSEQESDKRRNGEWSARIGERMDLSQSGGERIGREGDRERG
jgi:hypothetical protein